ncbi:BnaAnng09480D [Brassica napus]|uniref:BnaAnng09480D protein n=2 Tax=Brassica napus TaxID=3708 RepID=A0A078IDD6_BRANA|nr:BnaAnng09480D [Brassica napus]
MVVKMMKWRPWPPLVTRKYEVKLTVRRLEGWDLAREPENERLTVEIRWKGPKATLGSLRRPSVKRDFTKEAAAESDVVSWEEEELFQSVCSLTSYKEDDTLFYPWEIAFSLFTNGMKQGQKNKAPLVGTASLNLSEYARVTDQREFEINIPLTLSACIASEPHPLLCVSLSLFELRTTPETSDSQTAVVPVPSPPPPHQTEKEDVSAIKAGLRKVKIFVSTRKAKKACHREEAEEGRFSSFESSESLDLSEEASDECKEDLMSVRKSFSYGPLSYANGVGSSLNRGKKVSEEDEDWVYYSHRKSDVGGGGGGGCEDVEDASAGLVYETSSSSLLQRRSILPWRKRKLSFRSPKAKGEPLLKKDNGEEGGDDIDYDRRQLSSDEALVRSKTDEESSSANPQQSSFLEFGDDSFAIGSWEEKDVVSRDGHMKLQTSVFLASIDQRSERAAGESACTALVAVIADWFQKNGNLMPVKSQFDSLIREGSLEWRNLCENETYMQQFPDKHFDLDTVLQAKIRSLTVVPGKSFVGFFHPEGMINEGSFEFLQGAMSFDSIWDEIDDDDGGNDSPPRVYIVSWNDHFFVLKVENEAYYIIDTLGERLYEGCDQAYILKFDDKTVIHKNLQEEESESVSEPEVVCSGKESCKEYIKSFLAAIPIRELQEDIKKGLASTAPVHQRLQIEFHYTKMSTSTDVVAV